MSKETEKLKDEIAHLLHRLRASKASVNRAQNFRTALVKILHNKRCDCHVRMHDQDKVTYKTKKTGQWHHFDCPIAIADRALEKGGRR